MSQEFEGFDTGQKIEHINKTLELIAKQKVFYSRREMMANYVAEEEDSETEVQEMKERIDLLSTMYTGGSGNLLQVLQVMEDKLIGWKNFKRRLTPSFYGLYYPWVHEPMVRTHDQYSKPS